MSTSIDDLKGALMAPGSNNLPAMSSGMSVESDRAIAQVQGAMVIAKKFPRDEQLATTRIRNACQLLGVAENSFYSYKRGGAVITGPSIDLLKICARYWGNIDFSMQEIDRRSGESVVLVVAIDLETNARASRTVIVPHIRDKNDDDGNAGGKAVTSQRDIYEVWANVGSRRLRACLEDLIPPHIVGMAFQLCQDTLKNEAAKKPLKDRLQQLVPGFAALGVTEAMLVKYLRGRPLIEMLEAEYVQLRNVWRSIESGAQRVEDFFEKPSVSDSVQAGKAAGASSDEKGANQQAEKAAKAERSESSEKKSATSAENPVPGHQPTKDELIARLELCTTVEQVNAFGASKPYAHLPPADVKAVKQAAARRAQKITDDAAEQYRRAAEGEDADGSEQSPE
jgi:hypothetical protein